jgi:hypothetical protein
MFRGTLRQTSVYPREVMKRALHHNAAALVLRHNHPTGAVDASDADELLTRTLREALAMLDVRVIDHIIVAGARTLSLQKRGFFDGRGSGPFFFLPHRAPDGSGRPRPAASLLSNQTIEWPAALVAAVSPGNPSDGKQV